MLSLSIYIPLWYDSNGKSTFLAILGKELYIPPLCQVLDTYFFKFPIHFFTSILTSTLDFSIDY